MTKKIFPKSKNAITNTQRCIGNVIFSPAEHHADCPSKGEEYRIELKFQVSGRRFSNMESGLCKIRFFF